jgi:diacylglycerol kinase family enzyme
MPEIEKAVAHLKPLAGEIVLEQTQRAGSGGMQAREATERGCDLVLACGGDGTVLDALQGVAKTQVAFGVLPFGTANVLASDIDLAPNLGRAARQLASYVPRRIPVGRITYGKGGASESRYFTVAAGVGVHAELVYRSNARAKQRGGFFAYYLSGFQLLAKHQFVPFDIEITRPDGSTYRDEVLELVGMRVRSFGKFLSRWRPGSSLQSENLQLVLLRESTRFAMIKYVFGAIAGTTMNGSEGPGMPGAGVLGWKAEADVRFASCVRVCCSPKPEPAAAAIRCQADGEILGAMPVEMEIVPDALTLLMPPVS